MEIVGIGIDIIEIQRIRQALEKGGRFIRRFYTEREAESFTGEKIKVDRAAGIFAAKEAVVKAMGTGFRGFGWQEIEILPDPLGKPQVILYGRAAEIAAARGIGSILLSISHSRDNAIAQAMALGTTDKGA